MHKKDHHFYCEKCRSQCMIYRKGKHHRVLVCPHCGVLATNGILSTLAKGALKAIPGVGTAISLGETAYDVYKEFKGDSKPLTSPAPSIPHSIHRSNYPTHQRINDALR